MELDPQVRYSMMNRTPETSGERLWRKCKEEPLVPIGLLVTVGVLSRGIFSFYRGDSVTSQRMMRYRVLAQGATLLAVTWGLFYRSQKQTDPAFGVLPMVNKEWFMQNAVAVNSSQNKQLLPKPLVFAPREKYDA